MFRLLIFLLLLPGAAVAQSNSVRQSGTVSPRHGTCWTTSGVVQDCTQGGDPALNLWGLYAPSPAIPWFMDDASIAGPFNQLTIGYSATAWQISLTALGGATHKTLQFCVNGVCGLTLTDTGASITPAPGGTPTVTSGSGACGTAAAIAGTNNVFRITVGSSSNGGNCPVVFALPTPFAHPAVCTPVNETSGARGAFPATPTVTGVTITADSTFTAGDSIGVTCTGYN
jgi:hypothetical protein